MCYIQHEFNMHFCPPQTFFQGIFHIKKSRIFIFSSEFLNENYSYQCCRWMLKSDMKFSCHLKSPGIQHYHL